MKKLIFIIFLLIFNGVFSQTIERKVIPSSGGYFKNNSLEVTYTIGEPVIETFSANNYLLTQGFNQPKATDFETIDVIIQNDTSVCYGSSITLSVIQSLAQNNNGILWSTGESTASIQFVANQSTTYYVTVYSNNIVYKDSVEVTVKQVSYSSSSTTACNNYSWNGQTYSQTGTYTWTGTNIDGCDSVATLFLTINRSTASTETKTACDSYSWNGQAYTQSGTYTWSGTNAAGCDSLATLILTINNSSIAPTSINASTNSITAGNPVTLTVAGGLLGTAASWKWYSGSCGSAYVGSGVSITLTPTVTTTYFVRAEGTCNNTACVNITITVNPASCAPTGIFSSAPSNTICSGNSVTLTAQGSIASGAVWRWYKGSCGGGGCIGTGTTIRVNPTSNTIYYVRSEGGSCGTTSCAAITIIVLKTPSAPGSITGQTSGLCSSSNIRYSCSTVSGAISYQWVVPAGANIVSGQGTNTIYVKFGTSLSSTSSCSANTICVKSINSCGSSQSKCINISLVPIAQSGWSISGPERVRCGETINYSVSVLNGASSYTWVLPNGWSILSGQGTASISVRAGCCNGNIKVTANNNCGSGSSSSKYVRISTSTSRGDDTDFSSQSEIATWRIWPVPVTNALYLDAGDDRPSKIEIFDATGRLVYQSTWRTVIDTKHFNTGAYYIRIAGRDGIKTQKFEVLR